MKSMCHDERRNSPSVADCRPAYSCSSHGLTDRLVLDARAARRRRADRPAMLGARLEQLRRAQQAADMVGAERGCRSLGHVDRVAGYLMVESIGWARGRDRPRSDRRDRRPHPRRSLCASRPTRSRPSFEAAPAQYFRRASGRPIAEDVAAYYRERKIGLSCSPSTASPRSGTRRIPNEEIAEAAAANADIMIAFATIDPHKGKMGVREARALIEDARRPGLQVPSDRAGLLPQRPDAPTGSTR